MKANRFDAAGTWQGRRHKEMPQPGTQIIF
nr:MAG TPA: hypothetical protein [Siphoviridae sp. ctHdl3]